MRADPRQGELMKVSRKQARSGFSVPAFNSSNRPDETAQSSPP
jgi:hypothetical protein